ncbi:MAG: adenylate/guanylate cyclase domain-containing protein [Bacteroidia bacterium]|nr:adenylate/guanylate cyclase domain-containing protein [Bacteroidia bacterium]
MKNLLNYATILLFFLGYLWSGLFAQTKLEALEQQLEQNLSSEERISVLNELAENLKRNYPKSAFRYSKQAYELAQIKKVPEGIASSLLIMGDSKWNQGYYKEAYTFYEEGKTAYEALGDSMGIASVRHGFAIVDWRFGNFPKALEHEFKALMIRERNGDSLLMADSYYWLGIFHTDLIHFEEAIDFLNRSLRIAKSYEDKQRTANSLNFIGRAWRKQEEYGRALEAHNESLGYYRDLGDSLGVSDYFNNVGSIYRREENYEEALKYFFRALEIQEKLNDQEGIADGYNDIGTTYMQKGAFNESITYLNKALDISRRTGLKDDVRYAYASLSAVYDSVGDYENAYFYHRKLMEVKDSILDQKKNQTIAELVKDHEEETRAQKLKLLELDSSRNQLLGFLLLAALLLSLVFLIWMISRSRLQSKLNKELSRKNRIIEIEKHRSEELLLNILPKETADELMMHGKAKARSHEEVSVLFSDFVGFTKLSEQLTPHELVTELHHCFEAFDRIIEKYGIEKIKTIGDAYMCVSGLPADSTQHAVNMVKAGLEMQEFLTIYKKQRKEQGIPFFEARIGIHSGPVVAGIVGIRKFSYDVWGDTVNMASRMEDHGAVGKVNISQATYEIVQNDFLCKHRGQLDVKHKGKMDMYFVEWEI